MRELKQLTSKNEKELELIEIINQVFEETNKEQTRANFINNDNLYFDGIIRALSGS